MAPGSVGGPGIGRDGTGISPMEKYAVSPFLGASFDTATRIVRLRPYRLVSEAARGLGYLVFSFTRRFREGARDVGVDDNKVVIAISGKSGVGPTKIRRLI